MAILRDSLESAQERLQGRIMRNEGITRSRYKRLIGASLELVVARMCRALIMVCAVAGCGVTYQPAVRNSPEGSISSVSQAERHGLEVAATTKDQAREEILKTPTVFSISFEDDVHSWERARFFLENYTGAQSGHTSAVTKVVGARWSLESNPGLAGYRYEVAKDVGNTGFTYHVGCIPGPNGDVSQAALNAANLARFIRDGKLEMSLL